MSVRVTSIVFAALAKSSGPSVGRSSIRLIVAIATFIALVSVGSGGIILTTAAAIIVVIITLFALLTNGIHHRLKLSGESIKVETERILRVDFVEPSLNLFRHAIEKNAAEVHIGQGDACIRYIVVVLIDGVVFVTR